MYTGRARDPEEPLQKKGPSTLPKPTRGKTIQRKIYGMVKRPRSFGFGFGIAAVLLPIYGCKPGPTIPAPTSDPTEIVQAHLAALNSKDPAKIHYFVANYCVPAMQPVERIMLQIGKDSAPFTFQKLSSSSKQRIVAEVTNGDGVHEFLSAKLGPNSKITSLLLGPPLLTDDQAAQIARAALAAVNSQDPARIHAFFSQYADGPMGYLEKYMLSLGKWGPFSFEKITSSDTGEFVAEVKERDQTRGYFTARIASSGKLAYLSFGVPSMSNAFAEQVLKAHLAALNSRNPATIHEFVTTYCEPIMQPVEKTMLALGADGPYTLEQISSNSDGAVIADIANGRQEHCYLTAYFDPKYKVKELILSQL